MKIKNLSLLLALSVLGGCAAPSQSTQTTLTGAGIGAVAGALIGAATDGGNRQSSMAQGAVLGGVIGAIGGNVVNQQNGR